MSSPPPPSNNPNPPSGPSQPNNNEPLPLPADFQMEMNFFIPFPGAGPPGEGEGDAVEGEAAEGQPPRGGMMWTFHLQPEPPGGAHHDPVVAQHFRPRARPQSTALGTAAAGGSAPVPPPGGAVPQRSLPFSGPLNLPIPSADRPPPIAFPFTEFFQQPPPMPAIPAGPAAGPTADAGAIPPPQPNALPHPHQMVFIVRPDGSVGQMHGPPGAAPLPGLAPQPGADGPMFLPPGFMFPFNFGGLRGDPPPDPEKAKELLKSLPTVEKGLMKRVDRIYAAENVEEGGWKCGVCLEGWETEEDGEGMQVEREEGEGTGVKRLPCNHLFHADCLEPWFGTKHTCPSCRLDLDPLRTLRSSSTTSSTRPRTAGTAARAERQAQQHPYRPPSATGAAAPGGDAQPPTVDIADDGNGRRTINFLWDMRGAPLGPPPGAASAGGAQPMPAVPAPAEGGSSSAAAAPVAAAAVPPAPRRRMGFMPRILASFAGGSAADAVPASPDSPATPTDQLPRFEPVSPQPTQAAFTDPTPAHHHHHHAPAPPHVHLHPHPVPHFHIHRHGPVPPPAAPGDAPAATVPPFPLPAPRARRHDLADDLFESFFGAPPIAAPHGAAGVIPPARPIHIPLARLARPAATDPSAPAAEVGANPPAAPAFDFAFAFGGPGGDFPPPPRRRRSAPKKPLVQVPLEKWVWNHERELGWRCDYATCVRAPTSDEGDAFAELADGDRPKKRDLIPIRGGECGHSYHPQCIGGGISVLSEDGEGVVEKGEVRVRCGECEKVGRMWRWDMEGWEEEDVVELSCGGEV